MELLILLAIVLLFFGYRRLPQLGRSMGRGIREFKGEFGSEETPQGRRRGEGQSRAGPVGLPGEARPVLPARGVRFGTDQGF
jgi:TatA/E family protein of Tat protein translocase